MIEKINKMSFFLSFMLFCISNNISAMDQTQQTIIDQEAKKIIENTPITKKIKIDSRANPDLQETARKHNYIVNTVMPMYRNPDCGWRSVVYK
jgi:hypothetical protein